MLATTYEHITIDQAGVAYIEGTRMKVVTLVLETTAYGWSADELHFQHPHLTLGQIHSALAYYWDNKEALDFEIENRMKRVIKIQSEQKPSALVERLKSKGLLT